MSADYDPFSTPEFLTKLKEANWNQSTLQQVKGIISDTKQRLKPLPFNTYKQWSMTHINYSIQVAVHRAGRAMVQFILQQTPIQ